MLMLLKEWFLWYNKIEVDDGYPKGTFQNRERAFEFPYDGTGKAATMFLEEHPEADRFVVELSRELPGSWTGKGHLTDWIIKQVLGRRADGGAFPSRGDACLPSQCHEVFAYQNDELLSEN